MLQDDGCQWQVRNFDVRVGTAEDHGVPPSLVVSLNRYRHHDAPRRITAHRLIGRFSACEVRRVDYVVEDGSLRSCASSGVRIIHLRAMT